MFLLPVMSVSVLGVLVSEEARHHVADTTRTSGLVTFYRTVAGGSPSADPTASADAATIASLDSEMFQGGLSVGVAVGEITPTPEPSADAPTVSATPEPVVGPIGSAAVVGPLFLGGLEEAHGCTASVVSSPAGNVLVTAAHCLAGPATSVVFAPGYANGVAPYGTWVVTRAYASAAWLDGQDTTADYAFLVVTPSPTNSTQASVESVVGANALGVQPAAGQLVTMSGYPMGTGSSTVVCTRAITNEGSYPKSDCPGFVGGTSGGPWVASVGGVNTVTGVIGGLHQGGCASETYSAPFTAATLAVYNLAISAGSPPDSFPVAGSDGC